MTTAAVHQWEVGTRRGWAGNGLLVVLLLVAANAVYGGIGLVVNGMGMPEEWLANLPVDSWTLPGVALLVTVALPQLVAAWFVWRHHRWAGLAGLVAGAGLVLWIGVQVLVLRRYFFLQPVVVALGLLEMGLAAAWLRDAGRALTGSSSR
jgi:hypothetical protein